MLKQSGTLAKLASLGFLMLCLETQSANAFTVISFNGKSARWDTNSPISIEFDPNFGKAFNSSGCDKFGSCVTPAEAIQASVNSWKNVSGVKITSGTVTSKTISGTPKYDNRNQIKFYQSGWQQLPFAPPTSALAVTISTYDGDGKILDADIFINGESFSWGVVNSSAESDLHDLQNVITHEMGHFFGLNHSSEDINEMDSDRLNATMFFASYSGETIRRSLDILDIRGIQNLYTVDDLPQPVVDELSPNNLNVTFKGNATFEITGDNFLPTTSVVFARANSSDIVGRVNSVDNNKISVVFDVSNMQSGEYDLVIANSYKSNVRISKAFAIQNATVPGTYNSDSANTSGGGCSSNGNSPILIILLAVLLVSDIRYRISDIRYRK